MQFDHHKIYYSCDYCTSLYFPEESRDGIRVTDVEAQVSCPVCKIALVLAYAGNIPVNFCQKCRGVLIKQPDFLNVIQYIRSKTKEPEIIPSPVRMEELERKVYCPQCSKKMETHPYAGPGNIIIDNCPRCILNWLDYNELYRITHSPDVSARGQDLRVDAEKLFRSKKKRYDRD